MQEVQRQRSFPIVAVIGLVLGIALALIAQFALDSLADSSDTWHQVQHGTIFVAGILVGFAVTRLYALGQRRA